MANMTAITNAYKIYRDGKWGEWKAQESSGLIDDISLDTNDKVAVRFPVNNVRITQVTIPAYFAVSDMISIEADIIASIFDQDPSSGTALAQTVYRDAKSGEHQYTISGMSFDASGYAYIVFELSKWVFTPLWWKPGAVTASITYSQIPLTVEVITPTAYVDKEASFSFADSRLGATVTVTPYFGTTTPLGRSVTVKKDTFSIECEESWFTAAGVTSDSMRVTLRCSDTLGRTNTSASFTLNRYGAVTTTIVKPKSGQFDASQKIAFQWSTTGGDIRNWEAQWSTDQSTWQTMGGNRTGTETSFETEAGFFPAGTVYWRVRVLDYDTGWSRWVQASFTAIYNTASVTLTRPTSGTFQGDAQIAFDWTVTPGSGKITGTQLQISRDSGVTWETLIDSTGSVTSYKSSAAQFAAGSLRWRVRAKNSYQSGYEENWATANITIAYTPASITLTTPTSGQKSGSEPIPFAWSITNGSGSISRTIFEVSTDEGISWEILVNRAEKVSSYTSGAGQFPAGTLKWRVRARNQYQADYTVSSTGSVTITYSGVSQISPINSPTSGRISAASETGFHITISASDAVHVPFTMESATFHWRSGTSGNYTDVPMELALGGAQANAYIAGGTFPSGTIQWYASAVDNTGETRSTAVYTLQALNATVEAVPVSPANTIEGTSSAITFVWSYASLDGSTQSRAILEYSLDGSTWKTIADVRQSGTRYTAPAGFFSAVGIVYWRVQAYNAAGTAGPKSAAVSFTLFGASSVAAVIGDGKPFATISWQTEGQVAFELMIGEKHYGPYFGTNTRSYTLQEPLEDGAYTVRVRAQNRYGIWSEWVEAQMQVTNVPGPAVPISATGGEDITIDLFLATLVPIILEQPQDIQTTDKNIGRVFSAKMRADRTLTYKGQWERQNPGSSEWVATSAIFTHTYYGYESLQFSPGQIAESSNGKRYRLHLWNDAGELYSHAALFTYASPTQRGPLITGFFPPETGYFLIYRDGKLIGKTYGTKFVDKTAMGTHEYYAIQVLPGGYYTRSSPYPVRATASLKSPVIGLLEGGNFIKLELSTDADRAQDIQHSREVVHVHYSGSRFPTSEIGEAETLSVSFDTAWKQTDKAAADAFEALVGEDVILKTPGGYVIVGTLEGYELHDPHFYKSYRCTLQQGDWRDFVYVP